MHNVGPARVTHARVARAVQRTHENGLLQKARVISSTEKPLKTQWLKPDTKKSITDG